MEEIVILSEAYPEYAERMQVIAFLFAHWTNWPDLTAWKLVPMV